VAVNNKYTSLNINIVGRSYPIKVIEGEEIIAKNIEKELNQKINDFRINYKDVDDQDVLVMVLLSYAFETEKSTQSSSNQVDQKVAILEKLVENTLS